MYWIDTWRFRGSIEYEIKYPGRYGAKGEKRQKREKATPEQVKKQNQKNKENLVRRLIKANFDEGDYWSCLKYPKGIRKSMDELKKELKKFLDSMRAAYKKAGELFKYIYRMEIGEHGGIHIHIIFNRIRGMDCDLIAQKLWNRETEGRINFQSLYESGGYKSLAEYIVKPPPDRKEKKKKKKDAPEGFTEEERKELIKYSSSRNLIRPQPERKMYLRRTLRELIENGPKPTPGFYIEKDSIVSGVNPYTGFSYFKYTEIKIDGEDPSMRGGGS